METAHGIPSDLLLITLTHKEALELIARLHQKSLQNLAINHTI